MEQISDYHFDLCDSIEHADSEESETETEKELEEKAKSEFVQDFPQEKICSNYYGIVKRHSALTFKYEEFREVVTPPPDC